MSNRPDVQIPVNVCRWHGRADRFFAKYRDDEEPDARKRWKKIPGGAFPPAIDSEAKALKCARHWYLAEMEHRRSLMQGKPDPTVDWPAVIDAFCKDVQARVRGAGSTRHEALKRAAFLRPSEILCGRPIGDHDEDLAVRWVRQILREPLGRKGREDEPRDALTVRNLAKVLHAIYVFAQAKGYYARDRRLPTESVEFKAEITGALREKAKLGKETRTACPVETARALVQDRHVPELRHIITRTYFFTGLRPGELHALRIGDYREEHGVRFLDVREQYALPRKDLAAALGPLKTVWCRRKIPLQASLERALDAWLQNGWKRHVGRAPKGDDFLFPNASGAPFRELNCSEFIEHVRLAGCETTAKGVELDIYSLRHSFATALRRHGVASDARDRLLGHRPKDTKALHYEDEDLPLLAKEIARLPDLLDQPATTRLDDTSAAPVASTEIRTPAALSDLVPVLVTRPIPLSGGASVSSTISAEEVRFELTEPLRVRRFSKPLPSTARPLLQVLLFATFFLTWGRCVDGASGRHSHPIHMTTRRACRTPARPRA